MFTIVLFRRRSYFVQMFKQLHQIRHSFPKCSGGANPISSLPPKKLHHKMHTAFLNIARLGSLVWVQPFPPAPTIVRNIVGSTLPSPPPVLTLVTIPLHGNSGKYLRLAILSNNEKCHFSRSTTCLGQTYTCVMIMRI